MYYETEKGYEITQKGYEFERPKPGFFITSTLRLAWEIRVNQGTSGIPSRRNSMYKGTN